MIAIGETVPDFTLPRDGGGSLTLSALRPKAVVLYFYPKDATPACTQEALDFTAEAAAFAAAHTVVVGLSKDPVKAHDRFVKKQGLGVVLVSDAESDTCERYGVWGEKQMFGRRYMGILRTTLLIDGAGRLVRLWPEVSVKGHVAEVLAAARAL